MKMLILVTGIALFLVLCNETVKALVQVRPLVVKILH